LLLVHPEVSGAYAAIIRQFRDGLQQTTAAPVEAYALKAGDSSGELQRWLASRGEPRAVVTLGRSALEAVQDLGATTPVYAAALEEAPNDRVRGVSVFIDPVRFLNLLKTLTPEVDTVHLLYRTDKSAALAPTIQAVAKGQGLRVLPRGVSGLREAVSVTSEVLGAAKHNEAIWLHRGVLRLNDDLLLDLVIRESWSRRIPVFTSEAQYVKRGILFSLFPDYVALGRALGEMANGHADNATQALEFLQTTKAALNLRTARHLGVHPSPEVQARFEVVYPVR
jgi:putative ABC transport system substrate-binding protein